MSDSVTPCDLGILNIMLMHIHRALTELTDRISAPQLREHLKRTSDYSFKAISNLFSLLDVNNDGGVEREELRTAFIKYSALRQALGEGPTFK